MSEPQVLAIGQVADSCGVSVSAIRYYEERGLVTPTGREGGKRRFDAGAIGRVNFVRRAREAGFSLDQIERLLDEDFRDWRSLVSSHVDDLRRKRDDLDILITMLDEFSHCGCQVVASCPRTTS